MRQLLHMISEFKEYIVFGACVAVSLALLSLNDTIQIRTIRSLTVVAVGFFQDSFSFIPNYFDLRRENRILRQRNLDLASEVSLLRESKLENIRLRQLLRLKERHPDRYISANVIGKNLQIARNTITVDVGEADGVRVDMPIVTDAGLVGRVIATSGPYAIGQLMLNKDFRASAKVQRSRVDGIVQWEGGDNLVLKNVAKTLDVREGDAVYTSEYSSIFPAGIRIGLVTSATQKPGTLFQAVQISPAVDFARLEEVFVLTHIPDTSRMRLEKQILR